MNTENTESESQAVTAFNVVLSRPVEKEEYERIAKAILQMRGVESVGGEAHQGLEYYAGDRQARREIKNTVRKLVGEVLEAACL
jgi:hypothetical protein